MRPATVAIGLLFAVANLSARGQVAPSVTVPAPLVDHHQHLVSPALSALIAATPPGQLPAISAAELVKHLDAAGIARAVVHSTAYINTQPSRKVANAYERVKADNDWTSQQVALYPDRLVGFCAVSPLADWAAEEIARCAKDRHLRRGVKMHFANAEVDYRDHAHMQRVAGTFRAANARGMAIAVHMRPSITRKFPYGRDEALTFLNELLPAAPDVPVHIAHLTGTGSYFDDPPVDAALMVFIEAIQKNDPRMKNVVFDVAAMANAEASDDQKAFLAMRIRQLGIERVLFGSDAPVAPNLPASRWQTFRVLPLTVAEFRTIATNVAPYLSRREARGAAD